MKNDDPDFSCHEDGEPVNDGSADGEDSVFDADGEYESLEGWEEEEQ